MDLNAWPGSELAGPLFSGHWPGSENGSGQGKTWPELGLLLISLSTGPIGPVSLPRHSRLGRHPSASAHRERVKVSPSVLRPMRSENRSNRSTLRPGDENAQLSACSHLARSVFRSGPVARKSGPETGPARCESHDFTNRGDRYVRTA